MIIVAKVSALGYYIYSGSFYDTTNNKNMVYTMLINSSNNSFMIYASELNIL